MGFWPPDAVPVQRRKIFRSGLGERAQSSSRMYMVLTVRQNILFGSQEIVCTN